MAGSAFVFVSASLLQGSLLKSALGSSVSVDTNSFSWVSRIRLGVGQTSEIEKVHATLSLGETPESALPVKVQQTIIPSKAALRAISKMNYHRVSRAKRVRVAIQTNRAPATEAMIVAAPAADVEAESFRQMYRQMRVQFFTSIEGSAPTTFAAAPVSSQVEQPVVIRAAAPKRRAPAAYRPVVLKRPAFRVAPMGPQAAVPVSTQQKLLTPVTQLMGQKPQTTRVESSAAAAPVKSIEVTTQRLASYEALSAQTEKTYAQLNDLSEKLSLTTQSGETETTSIDSEADSEVEAPIASAQSKSVQVLATQVGGYPTARAAGPTAAADYSIEAVRQAFLANSQKSGSNEPTQVAKNDYSLGGLGSSSKTKTDADASTIRPSVVEAFEWKTAVAATTSEEITTEGWKIVRGQDHWPSVVWNPSGDNQAAMVSYNTALMLAKKADATLQSGTSIVFGKIPAGWNVEYSGRAERVVYFSTDGTLNPTIDSARAFAFVNAAPGAQTVILKSKTGSATAAVAVPVMNGMSAYLDMTAVTKRALRGFVLDATAANRKGLANVMVSVLDQPRAVQMSLSDGGFALGEVYAVGDFPLYVETDYAASAGGQAQGFKHRYRVPVRSMDNVTLFRMTDAQIQAWIGQLEGGVSPDSGLVVAAVPRLVKKHGDGRLFPSVRPVAASGNLTATETYVVSEEGQLQVDAPLEQNASRFVSVQVPEGIVAARVEDNNRHLIWSQLLFAQPGVVNVVGEF
jgi:hypothetical protein